MTNMKKILGAGTALALLLGVAACGSGSGSGTASTTTEKTDVTLTVWGPQEDQTDSNSWLPKMEAAFEKAHPEYNMTWKNSVVAEGDAATTVKQDPTAAADVYMFANDQLGTLIDAKAIGQLSTAAAKQVKKQNDESMVTSVTGTDGNLYGVPYTGNTWFMYYNKSKFSSDDIKSLNTMLTKGKVSFNVSNSWYLPAFYVGAGATIFGEDGTDSSAGIKLGDNATEVTKFLVSMVSNSNFVADDDNGAGLAALQNGTADVLFSGTWNAADVKKALGDNYGAAQLPEFTTEDGNSYQMKAFSGSKAAAYNPNAKSPKAAAQFAAFLGSTEAQKAHFEMRSIVPTDKSLASSVTDDPAAVAQMDTIANTSILQSTVADMANFWDPCATFGKAIANKQVTAANAAAKTAAWQSSYNK